MARDLWEHCCLLMTTRPFYSMPRQTGVRPTDRGCEASDSAQRAVKAPPRSRGWRAQTTSPRPFVGIQHGERQLTCPCGGAVGAFGGYSTAVNSSKEKKTSAFPSDRALIGPAPGESQRLAGHSLGVLQCVPKSYSWIAEVTLDKIHPYLVHTCHA